MNLKSVLTVLLSSLFAAVVVSASDVGLGQRDQFFYESNTFNELESSKILNTNYDQEEQKVDYYVKDLESISSSGPLKLKQLLNSDNECITQDEIVEIPELKQSYSWGDVNFYIFKVYEDKFKEFLELTKQLARENSEPASGQVLLKYLSECYVVVFRNGERVPLKRLDLSDQRLLFDNYMIVHFIPFRFIPCMMIKARESVITKEMVKDIKGKLLATHVIIYDAKGIEESAFKGTFWNLKSLVMKDGLKFIKKGAFDHNNFVTVVIPKTIKDIGSEAFANCRRLKYIEMPSSSVNIDKSAFKGCNKDLKII